MKTPDGWKLVPIEPTEEMLAVVNIADQDAYNSYISMVEAAPTPPAQEDEPVAVIDESDEGKFAELLLEGTFLKMGTKLYTRPDNSGLRKAAEEALETLEDYHASETTIAETIKKLRAALEGK